MYQHKNNTAVVFKMQRRQGFFDFASMPEEMKDVSPRDGRKCFSGKIKLSDGTDGI